MPKKNRNVFQSRTKVKKRIGGADKAEEKQDGGSADCNHCFIPPKRARHDADKRQDSNKRRE
jgi:hypothetical protein